MGKTQNTGNLTNAIAQDSSNNIGIGGAASGSYKFQVTGTTNLTGALSGTSATFLGTSNSGVKIKQGAQIGNPVTSGDFYNGLTLENNSTTNSYSLGYTSGGNFSLNYFDGSSTYSKLITIGSTGAATFSSSVTAAGAQLNFNALSGAPSVSNSLWMTESSSSTIWQLYIGGSPNSFAGGLGFLQNGSAKMVINTSGYVGIGTTTPNYLLEVAKNINGADPLINVLNSNSGSSARAAYRSYSDTGGGQFGTVSSTFTIDPAIFANETYVYGSHGLMLYATNNMRFRAGGTERMRLTSDGILALNGSSDVGNGSLDKISFGHLNGSYGWIQTWNATTLYLNKAGNAVYAGTQRIDNNSDARLKDNIESVKDALSIVLSLNGRKYNMKDEDGKLRYGFVAQEVQPHLSDFVTQSDRSFEKDGIKIENLLTLETSGSSWAALLVEAIKEQQAQIEELKQKIN